MVHSVTSPSEGYGRSPEQVFIETKGYGSARMTGSLYPLGHQAVGGVLLNGQTEIPELPEFADYPSFMMEDSDTAANVQQSTGREAMIVPEHAARFNFQPRSARTVQVGMEIDEHDPAGERVPVTVRLHHRGTYNGHKPKDKK